MGLRRALAPSLLRTLLVRPAIQATLAASIAFYLTVGMFEAIWAVLLRDHGADYVTRHAAALKPAS